MTKKNFDHGDQLSFVNLGWATINYNGFSDMFLKIINWRTQPNKVSKNQTGINRYIIYFMGPWPCLSFVGKLS